MRSGGITPFQSTGLCIFMEFLFCGIIQILRNLDLNGYILITADGRVLHGNNAFSSQADLGTGLHTFPDLQITFP